MHADVIHKFVFRLERTAVSRATLPEARVGRTLWPPDVLDGQVGHYFVHTREQFVAHFPGWRLFGVEPLTAHVAARGRADVAQEGVRRVRVGVGHERRCGALVVVVPALLERLLREQLAAAAVLAQVAGLVGVQRVGLVVRRVVWRRVRRGGAVLPDAAPRLWRHLQPVRGEMRVVGLEEGVHGGGGRRRRIAPFARHHPRGGDSPLMMLLTASSPTLTLLRVLLTYSYDCVVFLSFFTM